MALSKTNIGLITLVGLTVYVLIPTLFPKKNPILKNYTRGLVNTGNYCYANSCFQALSSLDYLFKWLEANPHYWGTPCLSFLQELTPENLISSEPLSLKPLLGVMESIYKSHLSHSQQDAHEMLLKILEPMGGSQKTPFNGQITDTITCLKCKNSKFKVTDFLVLERLPNEDILGIQSEFVNDYLCGHCNTKTVIKKTTSVSQLPQLLAVHVNRSTFHNDLFRNNSSFVFNERLYSYKLKAVIFHHGNHYGGHYTCARKQRKNRNQWWLISDSDVQEVNLRNILNKTKDAYLLFYEKE